MFVQKITLALAFAFAKLKYKKGRKIRVRKVRNFDFMKGKISILSHF